MTLWNTWFEKSNSYFTVFTLSPFLICFLFFRSMGEIFTANFYVCSKSWIVRMLERETNCVQEILRCVVFLEGDNIPRPKKYKGAWERTLFRFSTKDARIFPWENCLLGISAMGQITPSSIFYKFLPRRKYLTISPKRLRSPKYKYLCISVSSQLQSSWM